MAAPAFIASLNRVLAGLPANESPQRLSAPLFTHEGPDLYGAAHAHNAPFAKPGPYQTKLAPTAETRFRVWVKQNDVPFDPDATAVDYDMRGYWEATGGARWRGGHFPDTFKTPYDTTFSAESRYALPGAPFVWRGNELVDARSGKVIFRGGA